MFSYRWQIARARDVVCIAYDLYMLPGGPGDVIPVFLTTINIESSLLNLFLSANILLHFFIRLSNYIILFQNLKKIKCLL